MVEELSKDYAAYFASSAITDQQVEPILTSVEQMLNRLDEFESILVTVKQDAAASVREHFPAIVARRPEFEQLFRQIESLERIVDVAERNVTAMEQCVNQADEELNVNSLGLKGLLLRGKKWATEAAVGANSATIGGIGGADAQLVFKAPTAFRAGDYFDGAVMDADS